MSLVGKVSLVRDRASRFIRKKQLAFAIKTGYHSKYGQLIGVGKENGVAVFGDRINDSIRYIARITSLDKEGNKIKSVWTDGYAVVNHPQSKKSTSEIELYIDNFKTGISSDISSKTIKADGRIIQRSVERQDKKLGNHYFGLTLRTLNIDIWHKIKAQISLNDKIYKNIEVPLGKKIPKSFFDPFYNSRTIS